jgi:hypothetical protein
MKLLSALAVTLVALSSPASADPVTLDSCGQTVVDAVLGADLDCTATPGFAVIIAPKGRLDLAGHRLTSGAYINGAGGGGVQCQGDCIIEGGGGSIVADPTAADWYMAGYGVHAVDRSRGQMTISRTTISGYLMAALGYLRRMTMDSSIVTNNRGGCVARRLSISNTTLTGNGAPYFPTIGAQHLSITDSTIDGNFGVSGGRIQIIRSIVTGLTNFGVEAYRKLYAEDSSVEGNCVAPYSSPCTDIVTYGYSMPLLVNTTCSTSLRYRPGSYATDTWGICSND